MEATLRLLNKAFEKSGVSVVDPVGQPFNPELHEAMATQPSADAAPGTVLAVVQKGYRAQRPAAAAGPGDGGPRARTCRRPSST